MTIYNSVICEFEVPDHEPGCVLSTSLFEEMLASYTINRDGHLIRTNQDIVLNENENEGGSNDTDKNKKGSIADFFRKYKTVATEAERVMFHGFLPMHSHKHGPYTAKFINGVAISILNGSISDLANAEQDAGDLDLYLETSLIELNRTFPDTEMLRSVINFVKKSVLKNM